MMRYGGAIRLARLGPRELADKIGGGLRRQRRQWVSTHPSTSNSAAVHIVHHPDHLELSHPLLPSPARFHYIFLRDHCPSTLDPSSKQRLVTSGSVAEHGRPLKTVARREGLEVQWGDGHTSRFEWEWLREYAYDPERGKQYQEGEKGKQEECYRPKPWTNATLPKADITLPFPFSSAPASTSSPCTSSSSNSFTSCLITHLLHHGLVLIRHVPSITSIIEALTIQDEGDEPLAKVRRTIYGPTWDVKSKKGPENIAYSSRALVPHMDLMYYESPPGIQLLHCLTNTTAGGHSLFHDTYTIARSLSPSSRHALLKVPITHHYRANGHHMRRTRPVLNPQGGIYYSPPFQSPQLHCSSFSDVPLLYRALREWESLLTRPEYFWEFKMEEGDCVVFDNRRILHGRSGFEEEGEQGKAGERALKGAYVEWDDVLDKGRRVLGRKVERHGFKVE